MGAGAGKTLKGLVQNRNDLVLFFEGWEGDKQGLEEGKGHTLNSCACPGLHHLGGGTLVPMEQEASVNFAGFLRNEAPQILIDCSVLAKNADLSEANAARNNNLTSRNNL